MRTQEQHMHWFMAILQASNLVKGEIATPVASESQSLTAEPWERCRFASRHQQTARRQAKPHRDTLSEVGSGLRGSEGR